MTKSHNNNLVRVVRLTRGMIILADQGDSDRLDSSCGILYGSLRDAAYKLRGLAEKEILHHKEAGEWDNDDQSAKQKIKGETV